MDTNDPDTTSSGGLSNKAAWLLVALGPVIFFFLLDDLLGWMNGGGIFSFSTAITDANHKIAEIQIDDAALRTVFIALCAAFAALVGRILKIDPRERLPQLVLIFAIMGGGFLLDSLYGEEINNSVLANHGYKRCALHDGEVGHGKGRVWLDGYVLNSSDCVPQ